MDLKSGLCLGSSAQPALMRDARDMGQSFESGKVGLNGTEQLTIFTRSMISSKKIFNSLYNVKNHQKYWE